MSCGIVWEFLDTAGGDKIATPVFKAQYILGQEAYSLELIFKELNHKAAILHVYSGGLIFMK